LKRILQDAPMDIELAKDARNGMQIFIVQLARTVTAQIVNKEANSKILQIKETGN